MMKKAIYSLAAAAMLMAGCSDDLEQGTGNVAPAVEGEEIIFGASGMLTFEKGYDEVPGTRTVYGDASFDGTSWHYPLSWIYGDSISVFSPQVSAPENKAAHYRIEWAGGKEGDASTETSAAYLVSIGELGDALQWGNVNEEHTFYAFYPTSALIDPDAHFTEGTLAGRIPNVQDPVSLEKDSKGNWVAKPNMAYAFMRAENKVIPSQTGNKITLNFEPLVTAVEVTLTAESKVRLSQIQVSASDKSGDNKQAVCGSFTYNVDRDEIKLNNPDIANDYQISVSLWNNNEPLTLESGQSLTFTVFLLPGEHNDGDRDVHNLQVRVPNWEGATKVKTYEGVNIAVGTKSQIVLPKLKVESGDPENPDVDVNQWMKSLADPIYVSQLSIPGSANAFSAEVGKDVGNYSEGKETTKTQGLTVEEQFKVGVRAFEIAVERTDPWGMGLVTGGKEGSLGDAYLVAGGNGGTSGIAFSTAMERLAALVKANPSEFIVVMPYYSYNDEPKFDEWCYQLRNYLQKTGGTIGEVPIKPFTNDIIVDEARGSILFLSRIPASKENADKWVGTPQYTTAIYDWDMDRDRWGRRGYNTETDGYWTTHDDYDFIFWDGEKNPKNAGYTKPSLENWLYEAASASATPKYYIQDWYRVCPRDDNYRYGGGSTDWYESKTEKISNIQDFMTETVEFLKGRTTAQDVFINSLAGYYVADGEDNNSYSSVPNPNKGTGSTYESNFGKRGDVPAYARDMNEVMYKYIVGLTEETRGPLGIVLINYVNMEEVHNMKVYGDYIIRALIDNNFRFLLTGDTNRMNKNK